jgi:hypothetical protein
MSPNTNQTQTATTGLTPQEAAARLDQFGPNEPTATRRHSLFSDFLHAFSNPLVLILVIAAVISAFMGEAVDAGIIGVIVLLSAIIDVTQTYRSQQAMERLRDRVAPTAAVLRDGDKRCFIPVGLLNRWPLRRSCCSSFEPRRILCAAIRAIPCWQHALRLWRLEFVRRSVLSQGCSVSRRCRRLTLLFLLSRWEPASCW